MAALLAVDSQINVVERAVLGISAELIDENAALRESEDITCGQEGVATVMRILLLFDREKTIHFFLYFFHKGKSFLVYICKIIC